MKNLSTPSVLLGIIIGIISCGAVVVAKNDFFEYREMQNENSEQKSFDAVFLEDMIPHHEGAIEMSEAVLNDLQNEEVRQLAENVDREFLEQMIPHHEMAVMMAQMLLKVSTRQEMRDFAESIITVQNAEIAQMKNLLKKID